MVLVLFILTTFVVSNCFGATIFSVDPIVAQTFQLVSSSQSSWQGGIVPGVNDDVIIDLSSANCNASAVHYFVFDASVSFSSLTINVSVAVFPKSNPYKCTTRVFIRPGVVVTASSVTLSGGQFGALALLGGGATLAGVNLNILESFPVTGSGTLNFVTISANGGVLMPGSYYQGVNPVFPACEDSFQGYSKEMSIGAVNGDLFIKGTFTILSNSISIICGSFGSTTEFPGRFRPGRQVSTVIFESLVVKNQILLDQYGPVNSTSSMIEWKQLVTSSSTPFFLTLIGSVTNFFGEQTLCPNSSPGGTIGGAADPPVMCFTTGGGQGGYTGLGSLINPFGTTTCASLSCSLPCLNGGSCTTVGVCSCPFNYTGPSCSQLLSSQVIGSDATTTTTPAPTTTDSNNALVLGLAIGIPLGVAAGVAVGLAIYFVHKHKEAAYNSAQTSQLRAQTFE